MQARYLDVDAAGRKYDNPAAALAPNPRITVRRRRRRRRAGRCCVVCEGMPDALTAAQAGYRAVGLLGAQAPDAHRRRPRRQLRRPAPTSTSW